MGKTTVILDTETDPKTRNPRGRFRVPKILIGLFLAGLIFAGWYAWQGAQDAKAQAKLTQTPTQTPRRSPTATPSPTVTQTPRPTQWIDTGFVGLSGFRITPTLTPAGTIVSSPTYPPGAIVITVPVTQIVTQIVNQGGGVRTVKETVLVPQPYPVKETVIVIVTATPTNTITPTLTMTVFSSPTPTITATATPTITPTAGETLPPDYQLFLPVVLLPAKADTPDPYPPPEG